LKEWEFLLINAQQSMYTKISQLKSQNNKLKVNFNMLPKKQSIRMSKQSIKFFWQCVNIKTN